MATTPERWWPRRLLNMLPERIRWRGTERRAELPLPATARSQSRPQAILQSARGQNGKDASSSTPLLCSAALSFVVGEQLYGNTNTPIGSFWMQLLRAISLVVWILCYSIYLTKGTPADMSDTRKTWFYGLTVVFTLSLYIRLQQSPLALPGIAGIITGSTAASIWTQNLWHFLIETLLRLVSSLSVRPSDRLNERTEQP
ncbi:hypothetical protein BGZ57DRAFT_920073 [Hyaloscypha finlandica]|nr:hypothetical protein BGZ57DRAFT_920073 [Hyaloscypha finlandica]